jgi:hypothetical protein
VPRAWYPSSLAACKTQAALYLPRAVPSCFVPKEMGLHVLTSALLRLVRWNVLLVGPSQPATK